MKETNPCVTFHLFHFKGIANKWWAFKQMQFAHSHLNNLNGLTFYKLLGSGKGNGFNPLPDWSVYGFLGVWESQEKADDAWMKAPIFQSYCNHADKFVRMICKPLKVHGTWSGVQPFEISASDLSGPLLVITRATIATNKLLPFWRIVPSIPIGVDQYPGLLYTKGIGEWPFTQMATVSLWKDESAMLDFAYKDKGHLHAMQQASKNGWFKESLFARMVVSKVEGNWDLLQTK